YQMDLRLRAVQLRVHYEAVVRSFWCGRRLPVRAAIVLSVRPEAAAVPSKPQPFLDRIVDRWKHRVCSCPRSHSWSSGLPATFQLDRPKLWARARAAPRVEP